MTHQSHDETASSTHLDTDVASRAPLGRRPVTLFLAALGTLLVGYMFMGRGFAHLGVPPLYVGELVLAAGIVVGGWVVAVMRPKLELGRVGWLLLAFLGLGAVRTVPYLPEYGLDALRDGALWGYGCFALLLYLVADRRLIKGAARWYGRVVPAFALWLPISWSVAGFMSVAIDPSRPGEVIPLVYFKAGDMAVHIAGTVSFLAFGTLVFLPWRSFLARLAAAVPAVWTGLVGATANRGALVAAVMAVFVSIAMVPRWRAWAPIAVGALVAATLFAIPSGPQQLGIAPTPSASPSAPAAVLSPGTRPSPRATPSLEPSAPEGREVGVRQLLENIASIFTPSADQGLSGTVAFRLAWWSEIIEYTVFGEYFWAGKGFGINLANADGFQPTADQSLRAPHNTHLTVLARMGVPGFLLWIVLQAAFALGMVQSIRAYRRANMRVLAAIASWVTIYWVAMMVDTSFDPYLEGPQGGIWFWSIFGLGLVIMRFRPRPDE